MSEAELSRMTVAELGRRLSTGSVSAVELAQSYLDRIERHKDLNAFLDVRPEVTLAQARAADARIARGDATPLTGIPDRPQGHFRHPRFRFDRFVPDAEGLHEPVRRHRGRKTRRRRHGRPRAS